MTRDQFAFFFQGVGWGFAIGMAVMRLGWLDWLWYPFGR